MDRMQREFAEEFELKRKDYAERWILNAKAHETNKDYEWMETFLGGFPFVLEIGCGVGQSTLALCKAGHRVISIDNNPHCITAAGKLLRGNSIAVKVLRREQGFSFSSQNAIMNYAQIEDSPPADRALPIEGAIQWDEILLKWLEDQAKPFDAIVCCLIGGHAGQITTAQESQLYGLAIQKQSYEIADKLLRPQGKLLIVDRSEVPSEQFLKDDTLNAHKNKAKTTSLIVENLSYKVIPVSGSDKHIPLLITPGTSGRMPTGKVELALVATSSRKP